MTAPASIDVAHLRTWIGREERASEILTAAHVDQFNATFNIDAGPARNGEVAPRLLHWCLTQPAAPTSALGPDGHPQRGGFLPPVPLPRRMWAGGSLVFRSEARIGSTLTRTSRVADVAVKEGRTGPLCFVTVEHVLSCDGAVLVEERQDIVYREVVGAAAPPAPAAPAGHHRRTVVASVPLLFRYSALTFNGHRIHYDRRYATEVEGYEGLVVHGPLQATLLYQFATALRGAPPGRFKYRGLSPLFDGTDFLLHADDLGSDMRLWTARDRGPVAMSADASWT
jgi:3-methylfumaryl-CoA hydratase